MRILAMILAGGTGKELSVLTFDRAKTAIPFGGNYRIIDFPLSNCVHSGIDTVAVLAQYSPRSLIDHIGLGKPWDLNRKSGGVYILQPTYYGQIAKWYRGTADAIYQNMDMIMNSYAEIVLILSGDHVYKMDYREMAKRHVESGKPVTIALKEMKRGQRGRFGMVKCDADGTVLAFEEKPRSPRYNFASMGIYMFDREFLIRIMDQSRVDMVFDVIIPLVSKGKVGSYVFEGYWEDIGSISSYYSASMKLLRSGSMLFSRKWPIYTRGLNLSPAKFLGGADVRKSIVGSGCLIEGKVEHSILFPGVIVKEGAEIRNSIIFPYSVVSKDASVERTICDKFVSVGAGAKVGCGRAKGGRHRSGFEGDTLPKSGTSITLIGKRARIRKGTHVPGGSIITPDSTID